MKKIMEKSYVVFSWVMQRLDASIKYSELKTLIMLNLFNTFAS